MLLCLLLSSITWIEYGDHYGSALPLMFWIDLAAGAVAYVLVFFRRRFALPVAIATNVLSALSGTASGPATLAAVSLATGRRLPRILLTAVVAIVCGLLYAFTHPTQDDPWQVVVPFLILLVSAMMAWGMYIGSRRELIWTLRNRAERAEAEQEMRAVQARGNERERIAREMHDVLAHRISQISMHAGGLAFRQDLSAEEMRVSAGIIQEKAYEALNDLRGVLGVLRDDTTGALIEAPQPTWSDLPRLIQDGRDSGHHIDYEDLVAAADLPMPDSLGRTVYRIVQEGLTNAHKHAPGALVSVQVSGSADDGIDVLLRNPIGFRVSATPGSGLGLVGLVERAELVGGRLEHRTDGSMFVLHGWIPWPL